MKLSDDAVFDIIAEMEDRWRPMHELMRQRALHYDCDPRVDPILPDQYATATRFQTPLLARIGVELVARLCENTWQTHVEPSKDVAALRQDANKLEAIFEQGKSVAEDRPNGDLQRGLAQGLTQYGFGVIHWSMADHVYPPVPKPERLEPGALPTDPKEASEYEALYRDDGESEEQESTYPYATGPDGNVPFDDQGYPQRRKLSGYQQTDEALQQSYRKSCAEAGWAWLEEAIDPRAFMMLEDRSLKTGMAMACVIREMPLLQYLDTISRDTEDALSLNDVDKKLPVYGEMNAPGIYDPSRGGFRHIARIYQLWTRDEWYEVLGGINSTAANTSMKVIKSGKHPYQSPPFAMAYARINHTAPDPVNRYRPALDDLYKLKPQFDRIWTLWNALAEMNAIPYWYWKSVGDGAPFPGTDGQIEFFTRNAADAARAPEGYELAKLEMDTGKDFLTALQMLDEAMAKATPSTGQAEVEASTQPWTVRMAQAQASVEPRLYLLSIARALRQMRRCQAHVMSLEPDDGGFAQPPVVFARKDNGKANFAELLYVEPKAVRSLNIDVDIDATSAQERITMELHGIALLEKGLITEAQFYEEYAGRENADKQIQSLREERIFKQYIEPGLIQRELMKRGLLDIQMGDNGQFIDASGTPVNPGEVLMRNGQQPSQPLTPEGMQMQGGGGGAPTGPNSPMPPQMPGLPGMAAPGTMPIGGMQG